MNLTVAKPEDLSAVMRLINEAKQFLREHGVDQWQSGYPDEACILRDINSGSGYLVEDENLLAGYLCIDFRGEPAYETLSGSWQSERPYAVVHRLAIDNSCKGKGLSHQIFSLTEALCRSKAVYSIRADTDRNNEAMKHVLAKNGFAYCGTISFDNSQKIAYEKLI